jgi:hypothetical protein
MPTGSAPTLRRHLWKAAVAVALFVLTSALCLVLITPGYDACRRTFGRDFLAFYAAGTLVREGRTDELYDLDAIRRTQHKTARDNGFDLGDAVGPWWNPPPFAWAFAPLCAQPYGQALLIWTAVNLAAAAVAAWLLGHLAHPAHASDRVLVALLVLCSAPLLQALTHGQNSAISLLLVTLAGLAWRGRRHFAAGACIALLGYKPQLAAALAVAFILHRGWRAAGGLAYVASALLLFTAIFMPGSLSDYLHRLPQNLHVLQIESTYPWERHVTLKAFWRLLLQGRGPGETAWLVHALTAICAVPLLLALPFAAIRARSALRGANRIIVPTVVTAPLLMPFYFDYDLLLLAAAAVMTTKATRRHVALWAALYLWLFINPYVAGSWRLNLTVPLLWGLAASLVLAALRDELAPGVSSTPQLTPAPLPKAA